MSTPATAYASTFRRCRARLEVLAPSVVRALQIRAGHGSRPRSPRSCSQNNRPDLEAVHHPLVWFGGRAAGWMMFQVRCSRW